MDYTVISSSELIRYQLDMPAARLAGAGWNPN